MQVTKEDRIFKSLALLCVFVGFFINNSKLGIEYKLYIVLPMFTALMVLGVRKYLRDKRDGKSLTRYYMALGFILLSVLFSILMIFIVE